MVTDRDPSASIGPREQSHARVIGNVKNGSHTRAQALLVLVPDTSADADDALAAWQHQHSELLIDTASKASSQHQKLEASYSSLPITHICGLVMGTDEGKLIALYCWD